IECALMPPCLQPGRSVESLESLESLETHTRRAGDATILVIIDIRCLRWVFVADSSVGSRCTVFSSPLPGGMACGDGSKNGSGDLATDGAEIVALSAHTTQKIESELYALQRFARRRARSQASVTAVLAQVSPAKHGVELIDGDGLPDETDSTPLGR